MLVFEFELLVDCWLIVFWGGCFLKLFVILLVQLFVVNSVIRVLYNKVFLNQVIKKEIFSDYYLLRFFLILVYLNFDRQLNFFIYEVKRFFLLIDCVVIGCGVVFMLGKVIVVEDGVFCDIVLLVLNIVVL